MIQCVIPIYELSRSWSLLNKGKSTFHNFTLQDLIGWKKGDRWYIGGINGKNQTKEITIDLSIAENW